jgi:uncharacterized protein YndB with AHSA1/START domain
MSRSAEEVEVSLTVAARPATIFRFLSDPALVRRWLGEDGLLEPGVGGAIRVCSPAGPPALGRVVEWVEGERIAFTWGHPPEAGLLAPESTRVSISLTPIPGGTRLVLRHSGLTRAEGAEAAPGWRYFMSTLAWLCARDEFGPRLDATLSAYTQAWNEPDHAVRARLLAESFALDGTFRNRYAVVEGRDALNAHIGGVRRYMPGLRLERPGLPDQCHSMVRSGWRLVDATGVPQATGVDYFRLDGNGHLADATGFWDAIPATAAGA